MLKNLLFLNLLKDLNSKILFTKGIIKNYNVSINGKNFYHQLIDLVIKPMKKLEKLQKTREKLYY